MKTDTNNELFKRYAQKKKLEGIYFDQLVDVIDRHVEYDSNYDENIAKEYNIVELSV